MNALKRLAFFTVLIALCACNQSKAPQSAAVATQQFEQAVTLHGIVANDQGPVKQGLVIAYNEQGRELARTALQADARYELVLPAQTRLPLLLNYLADEHTPPSQRLIAAVVHTSMKKYDINPRSTQIAQQAKQMGGYTHKNMVGAAEGTGIVPDDNKTTAGFRGDPTKQYGGWH
jgi:hypothetical protein